MDYVTIIQGDDTNFLGDQFLVVNFDTNIDMSGFTATFTLGNVTLTYGSLSSKTFEIVLSDDITSNLALGKQYGELKLIDTQNRIRTVTSVIPFLVRKGVNEEVSIINNSMTVKMNFAETTLDIIIETPGIARTEATRVMNYCNEAKLSAQNADNSAQNTLATINSNVADFDSRYERMSDTIDRAYETCTNSIAAINTTRENTLDDVEELGDEKIELATQQANIATQKAQEATQILINKASVDLDNLSTSGQTIINNKLSKLGDTMTGNLGISKNGPCIQITNTDTNGGYNGLNIKNTAFNNANVTTPSATLCLGRILFQDVNGNATGWVQQSFNTSNQLVTSIGTRRNISSANKDAVINLYVDSAGNPFFNFPRCTARATTTSSASSNKVAVIVTNYKNGLTWYRVWSDGWIEQGGRTGTLASNANATVTFPKSFVDAYYQIQITPFYWGGTSDGWNENQWITAVEKTKFTIYNSADAFGGVYWRACGY